MLAAIPVAALGGVPVFDVVGTLPTAPAPYAQRVSAAAAWFGVEPPALTYDPEDVDGGPLLTEELVN